MTKIIDLCRENVWFTYLLESLNKDIGWIDFEKEIATVIEKFRKFFESITIKPHFPNNEPDLCYIVKKFGFFMEPYRSGMIGGPDAKVKEEYTLEYPRCSGNVIVNTKKIIHTLSKSLDNVAQALKIYLNCFVNATLEHIAEGGSFEPCPALVAIDQAVSFNYTNTYESLYASDAVFHLHGDVKNKIILGINPDVFDDGEAIDTSFLSFKKYFQRTLFETDVEYIKWIKEVYENGDSFSLIVMGHSLDATDKDVITDLFDQADKITILYHNEEAKVSYATNLVKIFGKRRFDELRQNKELRFLPQDMDFTDFAEELRGNSLQEFLKKYGNTL